MRCRRSSRRESTRTSATPRTIRTAIRFPDSELRLTNPDDRTLLELEPGARVSIARVPDDDPALLRYLGTLGLVPGSMLELVARAPFDGPVTVRTERGEHAISRELADRIAAA